MGDTAKGVVGLLVIGAVVYGVAHRNDKSGSAGGSGSSASSLTGSSTCDEWNAASSADEVALSQSIIDTLNAYDTSHRYAVSFANDITVGCEPVGSLTVAEVAGSIATLATADFPPQ